MKERIVLAFDIERSGPQKHHHTLAIGVCVVNSQFNEIDSLLLKGYVHGQTNFHPDTLRFWMDKRDILDSLKYDGPLSFIERQKEMIIEFQKFRRKWEIFAKERDVILETVSDNLIFDAGYLNDMIDDHTDDHPLPYTTCGIYSQAWETKSMLRGMMMAIDPSFQESSGFMKRLSKMYKLPSPQKRYNHNPVNDAYTRGYEVQVLFAIQQLLKISNTD